MPKISDIAATTATNFFHYPLISILSQDYQTTVKFLTECVSVYIDSKTEKKVPFTVLTVSRPKGNLLTAVEKMTFDHSARMGRSKVAHEMLYAESSIKPIINALSKAKKKPIQLVLIDEYVMFDLEKSRSSEERMMMYKELQQAACENNVTIIIVNGVFVSKVERLPGKSSVMLRTEHVDGEFLVVPDGKSVKVTAVKTKGFDVPL